MDTFEQAGPEAIAYSGKMLEIVQTPMSDGEHEITFEKARRAPGVRLIIADSANRKVLLAKEHRYELGREDFRLPGGKVVDTLQEFHEASAAGTIVQLAHKKAREEALEEVGIEVRTLDPYHISVVGATVEWDLHYFVAQDYSQAREGQQLEHGESITVDWYTFEEAQAMCLDGTMSEERSALVLLRWLHEQE